jgi:hypothetical protein
MSFLGVACATPPAPDGPSATDGKTDDERIGPLDSFETDASATAWHAADWANAGAGASYRTPTGATAGKWALALPVRFTGAGYAQAYVGRAAALSMAGAAQLVVDVTLPADAPAGLGAKLILFPGGTWSEGTATPLAPGATTHVVLPLAGSFDPVPERAAYKDVRGYGVKIEGSDVTWTGAVALDQVRLERAPAGDDAIAPVGVFGGFGSSVPTRNGFLTFVADTTRHALLWPKLGPGGGDRVVGAARRPR